MSPNDSLKFVAQKNDKVVNRFLLVRSAGATSGGYKLYGYDPVENQRNFLEDYAIDARPNHYEEVETAKQKIRFYAGDDTEVKVYR